MPQKEDLGKQKYSYQDRRNRNMDERSSEMTLIYFS